MSTPLKAIRAKCLDCSGGQSKEVRACQPVDCPLYPYRFGKNPKRLGIGNKKAVFAEKFELRDDFLDVPEARQA